MKKILILTLSFLVSACTTPITRNQIDNANFSEKPTDKEAYDKIKSHFEGVLIDPNSLILKCSPVQGKGWAREYQGDKPTFGYTILCDVNAKNRMGGYTGSKTYIHIINGSKLSSFEFNPQAWAKGALYGKVD